MPIRRFRRGSGLDLALPASSWTIIEAKTNTHEESDLALAARHVAEGRRIVARQRERIARLRALGCSTLDHEQTLRIFESTLEIFLDHEQTIREQDTRKNLAR
jgi:hypothetical protein